VNASHTKDCQRTLILDTTKTIQEDHHVVLYTVHSFDVRKKKNNLIFFLKEVIRVVLSTTELYEVFHKGKIRNGKQEKKSKGS